MLVKFKDAEGKVLYINPTNVSMLTYIEENKTRIYMNSEIEDWVDVLDNIFQVADEINGGFRK